MEEKAVMQEKFWVASETQNDEMRKMLERSKMELQAQKEALEKHLEV